MTEEVFEKLQRIANDEFGVTLVRADDSKISQMLLDELRVELKALKDKEIKLGGNVNESN